MVKDPKPQFAHEFDGLKHMYGFDGYNFVSTDPDAPFGAAPKKGSSTGGLPMGNGAEARFTFHYFPPGYGAQVSSPKTSEMRPMFIDTKNRWGTGDTPTRHGPVPKNSNVPPTEMYSGMMECPCSDRYLKTFSVASSLQAGKCQDPKTKADTAMTTAKECFGAAVSLGMTPSKANKTVSDATKPPGCIASAVAGGYEISFNSAKSAVACGAATNTTHPRAVAQVVNNEIVSFDVDVDMEKDLVTITASGGANAWFAVGLGSQTMDGVCVAACPPKPVSGIQTETGIQRQKGN